MKRWLDWFFSALAAGVAVAALGRKTAVAESTEHTIGDVDAPTAAPPPRGRRRLTALAGLLTSRLRAHNTVMIAASLSYYAMLSIFPAAIAGVSIYGLVFDPVDIERQIDDLTEALPEDAAGVIGGQLQSIVDSSSAGLTIATVAGIVLALWAASAGTKGLISGINIAYGEPETRSFATLRGIALLLTLGAIVGATASIALVTFVPGLLEDAGLGSGWGRAVSYGRWPAIFVFVVLALGFLYKIAPNRPGKQVPFFTPGAVAAALLWLLTTIGLSFYANNLGSFNETYGALGGVIVLMLWFFLSGLMILLGAELNDELEERDLLQR